jgi:anhydro-N-acetylmuramic acid kinase
VSVFLGLMSGTSLDGIDGAVVSWSEDDAPALRVLAHVQHGFERALRDELMALNQSGPGELERGSRASIALAHAYARVVQTALAQIKFAPSQVRAIGAHGQTVRHQPDAPGGGYTIQLLNGAVLAEATGIDVVCDLRSRDVAAGGQGAPLVPAFHASAFGAPGEARAALNLGGIANLTLLRSDGRIGGFDCGPGNVLLDAWAARHQGVAYDEGGRWAAQGSVDAVLLKQLLSEPYLLRAPPKSTGRDLFNPGWLDAQLVRASRAIAAADVQATLAEFTARTVADALRQHLPDAKRLIVCGGGALNAHLMARLATLLPGLRLQASDELGLPAQQVESVAFAWLAREFVQRRPGNRPDVTGATGPRLLGCLYPGV